MRDRTAGYALVSIAAVAWGTWPLILKAAPMHAALQSAIVMTGVTAGSLPVMLRDRFRRRRSGRPPSGITKRVNQDGAGAGRARLADWGGVFWLGIADALNVACFFAAYQKTTVAVAVLTHYLTPILVAAAAPLWLGERAQLRTALAVAVAFVGLAVLLEPWRSASSLGSLAGAGLGAASAVFYASNVIVTKRLTPVFSAGELMFFHGVVATPLLFALVPEGAFGSAAPRALGVIVVASLGPGALGGLCFLGGLRRVPASHASVLTLLEPLTAVVAAAVVLGERLSALAMVGGALILVAAYTVVGLGTRMG